MNKIESSMGAAEHISVPCIPPHDVTGGFVDIDGAIWYKISNSHQMPRFFLSGVSSGDHWMFVASDGALTAGRQNSDSALFPYYSSDKILDSVDCTGPKTLMRVRREGGKTSVWEPFAALRGNADERSQNLYKNSFGNRILFEEINHSLQLAFRYCWTFGQRFGFIRHCELINLDQTQVQIDLTDGLENVLPSGLGTDFQLRYSNLGNAYKRSERLPDSSLALYYLSSIPSDRAEPSEGLRATVVWQYGLKNPTIAVSAEQLDKVRSGGTLAPESDVRGRRGAFFASERIDLLPGESTSWTIVADVNYDHSDIIELNHQLVSGTEVSKEVDCDVDSSEARLLQILSAADGRQIGADRMRVQRHQSNVLFNVMRGGIPSLGYQISAEDFGNHVHGANKSVGQRNQTFLNELPPVIPVEDLQQRVAATNDSALERIALEYLPLRFSRRHGDPTRPWNKFSIDLWAEDGSENLSYQGNWRDIFQNWEALAVAYPQFTASMVFRFLNASTADGYNPYRINKDGFDWEEPDPNDPWSNIGYWGDHQIIYLLKLIQWCRDQAPSRLESYLTQDCCTYADIPYRIRSHEEICRNPHVTIDFDSARSASIARRVEAIGSDGKLLTCDGQQPYQVNLVEKLLVPALTKLTNFVPGGGVWLNTQRPEWNDANNALVGRGISMVTACYLRRYLTFLIDWFTESSEGLGDTVSLSRMVGQLADRVGEVLVEHADAFEGPIDGDRRRSILDALSTAGSDFRAELYDGGICGGKDDFTLTSLVALFRQARRMVDHAIRENRRDDGMYHSYNLMQLDHGSAHLSHLYEMLEGQVAVLSSGLLTAEESLEVLDALRSSKIYREDQQSYMLYPDRELPRFLDKNTVSQRTAFRSPLLKKLIEDADSSVIRQDIHGDIHFNGQFCNVSDLNAALDCLQSHPSYSQLVCDERKSLNDLFEETFTHRNFTGRSGTFFAYEGLGSIYWHMVSKLSLVVMEQCVVEHEVNGDSEVLQRLHAHYREIRDGIGLTKDPMQYGAFPADPYSHTPEGAGVQQPGMTGQVKEDVLSRWDELGIRIRGGQLSFDPVFFESSEWLQSDSSLDFFDVHGVRTELHVPKNSFALTLCQVPIVFRRSDQRKLVIRLRDGETVQREDLVLSVDETETLFSRSGAIAQIEAWF